MTDILEFSHPKLPYARRGFRYNSYKFYLDDQFGERVQRISLEGGFTCPNRDGSRGRGGCDYCSNESFAPRYARRNVPLTDQIAAGKSFLEKRFGARRFIAYFQSYSNTYAEAESLRRLYSEALNDPEVIGLAVSTRVDCLNREILDMLSEFAQQGYVNLELGIESVYDQSLERMNRGHGMDETFAAFELLKSYSGLDVTGHMILGYPGEDRNMMMAAIGILNTLPLTFLKLHHLQIIAGTRLAREYEASPFPLFDYGEYLDFVGEYLCRLRPGLILQRVFSEAPGRFLIAPVWKRNSPEVIMDLQKSMEEKGQYQSRDWNEKAE